MNHPQPVATTPSTAPSLINLEDQVKAIRAMVTDLKQSTGQAIGRVIGFQSEPAPNVLSPEEKIEPPAFVVRMTEIVEDTHNDLIAIQREVNRLMQELG